MRIIPPNNKPVKVDRLPFHRSHESPLILKEAFCFFAKIVHFNALGIVLNVKTIGAYASTFGKLNNAIAISSGPSSPRPGKLNAVDGGASPGAK